MNYGVFSWRGASGQLYEMAVRTLCHIVDAIQNGETTLNEFEDYLTKENLGRTPKSERKRREFGDACYSFVSDVLTYLEVKSR